MLQKDEEHKTGGQQNRNKEILQRIREVRKIWKVFLVEGVTYKTESASCTMVTDPNDGYENLL